MFGIGTPELVVILIVALVVLGPKRLPEVGRAVGKALGELRRATTDLKESIEIEARRSERPEAPGAAAVARGRPPAARPLDPPAAGRPHDPSPDLASEEPKSRVEADRKADRDPEVGR